ncbi:hypothetical protein FNV43_RR02137 [Rhamnella rubrinervis]|uniref:Uncharacterized protein n=1 Tax=Rhamnella rubrinervis TaxID=2594499 RepID=A0A8K0HS83_9ROSA|nr:hypothetical protein FNV43_RR02137 [Rhamnella rubrinervis]
MKAEELSLGTMLHASAIMSCHSVGNILGSLWLDGGGIGRIPGGREVKMEEWRATVVGKKKSSRTSEASLEVSSQPSGIWRFAKKGAAGGAIITWLEKAWLGRRGGGFGSDG